MANWVQVCTGPGQWYTLSSGAHQARALVAGSLGEVMLIFGVGDPATNQVPAPVGSVYFRQDGGPNTTFYVKEAGSLSDPSGCQAK